jgi:hypothetical protein
MRRYAAPSQRPRATARATQTSAGTDAGLLPKLPKYRRTADGSALTASHAKADCCLSADKIQHAELSGPVDGGLLYKLKLSPRSDQISAFSLVLTLFNFAQYSVQHVGSTQHRRFLIDNAPGPDR